MCAMGDECRTTQLLMLRGCLAVRNTTLRTSRLQSRPGPIRAGAPRTSEGKARRRGRTSRACTIITVSAPAVALRARLCSADDPGAVLQTSSRTSSSRDRKRLICSARTDSSSRDRLLGSMNDSFAGRYDSFARLDLVFGTQHKAAEALLEECRAGTIDLP